MTSILRHKFSKEIISEVRELYQLNNANGLLALVTDYAVIALCIVLAERLGWVAYPVAALIIGSRQRALATLTHEASHQTLARNRYLNHILGTYCSGYLIGMLMNSYRRSHVQDHHGEFGDPAEDGDYRYMLSMGVYTPATRVHYIWTVLIAPLLLFRLPGYLAFLIRERLLGWSRQGDRAEILKFAGFWMVLLAIITITGQWDTFLLYWTVPFLTSYQIIGWYIELAEHAPMMRNKIDIEMSRNRNSHWLERALTGIHGESYHLAHHLFPRVPFWKMQRLNTILRKDPAYRRQDDQCGGILLSSNSASSLVSLLWHLHDTKPADRSSHGALTQP